VQNLPLAQFYQMTVDNEYPFHVYGGVQDSGSWEGPTWVWESRGIINAHWRRVGTGDGFATLPDMANPRFLYNTRNNGAITRFDRLTGERREIEPPPRRATRCGWNWNTAMAIDKRDSATVYVGSQYVHRSRGRRQDVGDHLAGPDHGRSAQADRGRRLRPAEDASAAGRRRAGGDRERRQQHDPRHRDERARGRRDLGDHRRRQHPDLAQRRADVAEHRRPPARRVPTPRTSPRSCRPATCLAARTPSWTTTGRGT
jgi:hypothetical protein